MYLQHVSPSKKTSSGRRGNIHMSTKLHSTIAHLISQDTTHTGYTYLNAITERLFLHTKEHFRNNHHTIIIVLHILTVNFIQYVYGHCQL